MSTHLVALSLSPRRACEGEEAESGAMRTVFENRSMSCVS